MLTTGCLKVFIILIRFAVSQAWVRHLFVYKTKCAVNPCVQFLALAGFGWHSFTRMTTTSLNSAFTPCAPTCVNTSHSEGSQSTAVRKMKRASILQNSAKIPQRLSENSCCLKEQGMISDRRCLY